MDPPPRPSPARGEGEAAPPPEEEPPRDAPARGVLLPPRFDEPRGKFADSPYFFIPA